MGTLCTMNIIGDIAISTISIRPPQMLVRKLVECASKGGNMILNVGPDAKGKYSGGECSDSHRSWKMDEKKWGEHLRMRNFQIGKAGLGKIYPER